MVYVPKEKDDIPQFLEVTYGQEIHFLLITVPGRRTECWHCSCTDHWSKLTQKSGGDRPRALMERRETFAEKVKKAPPPPTTESAPPKHDTMEDGEADVDSDSATTWTVVTPRKKRRRHGPTPRTSPTGPAAEDSFFEMALRSDHQDSDEDNNNGGDKNVNDHSNEFGNSNDNKNSGDEKEDNNSPQTRRERATRTERRTDKFFVINIYIYIT